jgi:hypothetical protein
MSAAKIGLNGGALAFRHGDIIRTKSRMTHTQESWATPSEFLTPRRNYGSRQHLHPKRERDPLGSDH